MEQIIQFRNRNNQQLVGITHLPVGKTRKTGVLFVHSGVQGRHGNTNQYVAYARAFCEKGFLCLRFDPHGLGDSEGVIEPMKMTDFYGSIQQGRYADDILCAIDEFKKSGVRKVVLFGLCGGGITALLAASMAKDVCGALLLSAPVMLDSSGIDYQLRIPKEIAYLHLSGYLRKIKNPKYWKRFITFKSDYSTILGYCKAILGRRHKSSAKRNATGSNEPLVNKNFFSAYRACKHNISFFWIFGSNDSFWHDFKREVLDKEVIVKSDKLLLIEHGNHMFSLQEWQRQIEAEATKWLVTNFL